MIRGFDSERALEVRQLKYGSAYRIGGRLVLTSSHLLAEIGSSCSIKSTQNNWETDDAIVIWKASSADIALIELPESIESCEAIVFGLLPQDKSGGKIKFQMYGCPGWGWVKRDQGYAASGMQVDGTIYLADELSPDGGLRLRIDEKLSSEYLAKRFIQELNEDQDQRDIASEWRGMSGAAVVCDGLVVAVQKQHQSPMQPNHIEADSLQTVFKDKQWRRLLGEHGINWKPETVCIQNLGLALESVAHYAGVADVNPLSESDELDELLPVISSKEFSDLLDSYEDDFLSTEIRQSIFDKLLSCSWNFVINQSSLEVSSFFRSLDQQTRELDVLFNLLRKFASSIKISDRDLVDFFDLIGNEGFFSSESGFEGCTKLVKRIIIFILYDQPELLSIEPIKKKIKILSSKRSLHWIEFWVDLHLRYEVGKIYIQDTEILKILFSISKEYREQYPQKPISGMFQLITLPLEATDKYRKDSFCILMKEYARKSRNFFECKWCVATFQRIIPLMNSSEDDENNSSLIRSLLEEFDQSLRLTSPQLQSIYLGSLLRDFIYTRNIQYLMKYEKYFMVVQKKVPISLRSYFQLEYACCLQICNEFDYDKIAELSFGQILRSRQDPLGSKLLGNYYLDLEKEKFSKSRGLSYNSRRGLQSFLSRYIATMYRMYANKLLENNHTCIREFPGLTRMSNLMLDIRTALLISLKKNINLDPLPRPIFYARSFLALSRIRRDENLELIRVYVERALQASDYSVIRNAKDLAWGLYSCYYYGPPNERQELESLTDKLAKTTGIITANTTQSSPKLHWLYYAGIKWQNSSIDQDLINDLHRVRLPPKMYQLKLKRDESFFVSDFFGEMLETIISYRDQGSVLAAALKENVNVADAWNIIGTIVFDNRQDKSSLHLSQAARCYALAKCFARETKLYDQKYCFNYIRCKGLSLQLDGLSTNDIFYVVDTTRYLQTQRAAKFGYKKECITPYLTLIQDNWSMLELNIQQEVVRLLDIWWIKKELSNPSFHALSTLMKVILA